MLLKDACMRSGGGAVPGRGGEGRENLEDTTHRRLVAKSLARQFSDEVESACSPFQFALSTRAGTDCVGHAIRAPTDANPLCFGQSDFGHPYLTDFGQFRLWSNRHWPKKVDRLWATLIDRLWPKLGWPTLAKPTLANFTVSVFSCFSKKTEQRKNMEEQAPFWAPKGGTPKGGAPKSGGPEAAGVSQDNPRAQTCTFKGSGLQKQNSMRRHPERHKKNEMVAGGKKRAKFWLSGGRWSRQPQPQQRETQKKWGPERPAPSPKQGLGFGSLGVGYNNTQQHKTTTQQQQMT